MYNWYILFDKFVLLLMKTTIIEIINLCYIQDR